MAVHNNPPMQAKEMTDRIRLHLVILRLAVVAVGRDLERLRADQVARVEVRRDIPFRLAALETLAAILLLRVMLAQLLFQETIVQVVVEDHLALALLVLAALVHRIQLLDRQ